jgi:predicted RNA-binding Zn-ribbon protein involved in translation (DUF1610 family)
VQEKLTGQLSSKELAELRKLKIVRKMLRELKKKGKSADIPICPNCKSARLIRLTSFRDLGYIGSFHPAYYCLECGWYGRNLTLMSNRDMKNAVLEDLHENFGDLLENDSSI